MTHLIAIDVSGWLDGDDVGVRCEDLVQHRTMILTFIILVVMQGNDVLECQRLSCNWMLMELSNVGVDVAQIIHCSI